MTASAAGISDRTVIEDEKELKGWLIVLSGEWKGKDYRLFSGKTVVGSSPYSGIYLPDEQVETFHFSIRFEKEDVWITDLDSDSGLFIGEKRIHREKIGDETLFKVANIEFLIKLL